ncbi:MAG: nickel-responsive transcriptional regulator NikR [Candidatus Altiarchaeota archaeon]
MDRAARFGVSMPSKQLEKFDKIVGELDYPNRSKALNDAVTDFIKNKRWDLEEGVFVGSISYLYDHHKGDVTRTLTEVQHKHNNLIKSTMHSHISHDDCIEVLIVSGPADGLRRLYNRISAVRGVENCKIAILGTNADR